MTHRAYRACPTNGHCKDEHGRTLDWGIKSFDHTSGATLALEYRFCACGGYRSFGRARITPTVYTELLAANIAILAREYVQWRDAARAVALTNVGGPKTPAALLARDIYEDLP